MQIQVQMAERALELLMLPGDTPCYVLDVGCVCVCVCGWVCVCVCVCDHMFGVVCVGVALA